MIQVGASYLELNLDEVIAKLKEYNYDMFYKTIDTPQNLMVCCPFHKDGKEKKPSMGIHKQTGVCHCFACDYVGSLSEMISNYFGYDDYGRYGEKWLLKNFDAISVEERDDVELDFSRKRYKSRDSIITDSDNNTCSFVSEEELDTYRYTHPYMYKRGLTDEIIELFDVGYDRNSDSITFPVRDIDGNTLFIARREIHAKRFNYPQGVEKPVYGLYELKYCDIKSPSIIICESIIDCLTCWVYGKPAFALNGLGTEKQFEQLRNLPCRHYILATDMDEAGLKARRRIKKELPNKLITEYQWDLNKAKDINDMDKEMFDSLQEYYV